PGHGIARIEIAEPHGEIARQLVERMLEAQAHFLWRQTGETALQRGDVARVDAPQDEFAAVARGDAFARGVRTLRGCAKGLARRRTSRAAEAGRLHHVHVGLLKLLAREPAPGLWSRPPKSRGFRSAS